MESSLQRNAESHAVDQDALFAARMAQLHDERSCLEQRIFAARLRQTRAIVRLHDGPHLNQVDDPSCELRNNLDSLHLDRTTTDLTCSAIAASVLSMTSCAEVTEEERMQPGLQSMSGPMMPKSTSVTLKAMASTNEQAAQPPVTYTYSSVVPNFPSSLSRGQHSSQAESPVHSASSFSLFSPEITPFPPHASHPSQTHDPLHLPQKTIPSSQLINSPSSNCHLLYDEKPPSKSDVNPVPFTLHSTPSNSERQRSKQTHTKSSDSNFSSSYFGRELSADVQCVMDHGPNYIPPLMASFFFSEELASLFDDDFRVVWSPVQLSLERATELYNQRLYPTRNKVTPSASSNTLYSSPVSEQPKHPFHNSIRVSHGSSSTVSEFEPRSASSISLAEGITRKQKSRATESSFQRRTYYGGMKKCDEHRAPFAAHQNDTACNALLRRVDPPFQQSHAAYRVASDKRGHPSYMAIQGVHSGQGPESIARNFSFQRQTNYPFRKTYMPPVQPATRSVGTVSERRNTSPIASSLSSRVPVFDLSHPLSEVIGSWGGIGGLFFRPDNSEQPEFVDNLEDGGIILSIGNDGKLTSKRS